MGQMTAFGKHPDSVPVWALLGYENHEQASGKDLTPAEGPKQAKWAVVLSVSWKKPKD
jgi:hypothetical protein